MTTAVLITGTSSGIGEATALRLARHRAFTVYATARRPETVRPALPAPEHAPLPWTSPARNPWPQPCR